MNSVVPAHAAVWFEIPVTDMARSRRFYGAVLAAELADQEGGPNPLSVFPSRDGDGVTGHIYPGTPAAAGAGSTIHLAVSDLEAAIERVGRNGGTVVSPVVAIPAGRFAYCLDPDGNSFGLFAA